MMKIRIRTWTPAGGPETVEVRAWDPFKLYGHIFCAYHRPSGWYVAEVSTGLDVGIGQHPTRRAALTAAHDALTRRGKTIVRAAVKQALREQAKQERKVKNEP